MAPNLTMAEPAPAPHSTKLYPMAFSISEHIAVISDHTVRSLMQNFTQPPKASNCLPKQLTPRPYYTSVLTTKQPLPPYYTMNTTTSMPAIPYDKRLNSPRMAGLLPLFGLPHIPTSLAMTSPTCSQKQEHTPQYPAPLQLQLKPGYEPRYDKPSSTSRETKSQTACHHPLPTQNTFNTYHSEHPEPSFGSDAGAHLVTPGKTRTPETAPVGQEQYLPTTTSSNVPTYTQNENNYASQHPRTLQYHNLSKTGQESPPF
jgi:hypothetical protein